MIPQAYEGREHSFIKHQLLEGYIKRLFMIVGQKEKVIKFVDCFAGPWESQDEEFNDTSIGIVCNIMRECKEGLKKSFRREVNFEALFIEKSDSAYSKLKCFCDDNLDDGINLDCRKGDFHKLISEILRWCGNNDFVFFFIDPKGWKNAIEIPTLEPMLQRPRSEFLVNLMFPFIVRVIPQQQFRRDMSTIFGSIPSVDGMCSDKKEEYLLHQYREYVKKVIPDIGGKPRSAYVRVEHPVQNRTKYDLVYFTHSPMGIKVFIEVSEKLDNVQRILRAEQKQKYREYKSSQLEFAWESSINVEQVDSPDIETIKSYWLQKLSFEPQQYGIIQLADMLEETGWFISDLQKGLKELQAEGLVKNLDCQRKRPKHSVHFHGNNNAGELLVRLK